MENTKLYKLTVSKDLRPVNWKFFTELQKYKYNLKQPIGTLCYCPICDKEFDKQRKNSSCCPSINGIQSKCSFKISSVKRNRDNAINLNSWVEKSDFYKSLK